jgi:hypothetical protein
MTHKPGRHKQELNRAELGLSLTEGPLAMHKSMSQMEAIKARIFKNLDYVSWDRLGMGLSLLCAVHCLVAPLIILSIPLLARYYLVHPLFHFLLALAIIPVGLLAFLSGIRHHHNWWVLVLGIPGLALVTMVPYMVHVLKFDWNEQIWMVVGSLLLMSAHLINRKSCVSCRQHKHHQH